MLDEVKNYYGKTLQHSDDLLTNACCTAGEPPQYMKDILSKIHDDVMARYYGCGLITPALLKGAKVLDLGSGAGRDVYTLSALVGEEGSVTGVDMTEEQLNVARKYRDFHAQAFGYEQPNVDFVQGQLEDLGSLGFANDTFDVVVSNCVINLCIDKRAVLKAVYDLLKPGGEMYFSDVYASRRIPDALKADPVLYGECLSGAFYWNDFLNTAKAVGFKDPRLVSSSPIIIENEDVKNKLSGFEFYSATYRLFKIDDLESDCEDYGQAVVYKGGIEHQEAQFILDAHHVIDKGKVFPVCGNTDSMLRESRFADYFEFIGNRDTHFGIFDGCGTNIPFVDADDDGVPCC